jgi:hypothetical protein
MTKKPIAERLREAPECLCYAGLDEPIMREAARHIEGLERRLKQWDDFERNLEERSRVREIRRLLISCVQWNETPQGNDYWDGVRKELERILGPSAEV